MDREGIRKEYETTDIKPKALAEKHGVKYDTLKSWMKRDALRGDKWEKNEGAPAKAQGAPSGGSRVHPERSAPAPPGRESTRSGREQGTRSPRSFQNDIKGSTGEFTKQTKRQRGGQPGNDNAAGYGAPLRNRNAVTHGLYSKFLPDDPDTLEILQSIHKLDEADMLWSMIEIKYLNLIRTLKIMFVKDREDITRVLKKRKVQLVKAGGANDESIVEVPVEEEWELQMPWDKMASTITAQARATAELRSLLKQFREVAGEDDERLLRIEKMQEEINATKARVEIDRERLELERIKVHGKGEEEETVIVVDLPVEVGDDDVED